MRNILNALICFIFLSASIGVINSTTAENIYSTNFEDGNNEQLYSNDWIETKQFSIGGGETTAISNLEKYSGEKSFKYTGGGTMEWAWDFTLGKYSLKKFEMMLNFKDGFPYSRFHQWDFYDKSGLIFACFTVERAPTSAPSDVIIFYRNGTSYKTLGVAMKDNWVKFGFQVLSNNSLRYYFGDHSVIDTPNSKVPTMFPYLTRFNDDHANGGGSTSVFIDDITIYTNYRPTADPNGPYAAYKDQSVALDGSDSIDLDGTISKYNWDFGDGETGSGEKVDHTYNTVGRYTVSLTVTDDDGATDSQTTTVIVQESCEADAKSPGFEITFAIAAIGLILLFFKKRRK